MSPERSPGGAPGEAGWKDWVQARLRRLASDRPDALLDDLEIQHLVDVILHSSQLLDEAYTEERLGPILGRAGRGSGALASAALVRLETPGTPALARIRRLPDDARAVGDQCLFDVGVTGRTEFRGLALPELGIRAYRLASELLGRLAEDRRLREHFEHNRLRPLPLDEEIAFLRQCAQRFGIHAEFLRSLVASDSPATGLPREWAANLFPLARPGGGIEVPPGGDVALGGIGLAGPESPPEPVRLETLAAGRAGLSGTAPLEGESLGAGRSREEVVAAYERMLLFSSLDLAALRDGLRERVIGQNEAIQTLCDEFALHAAATQDPDKPGSFLLVGPTGVGKNHLVESLARLLEAQWRVPVPMLVIEAPNYTDPSDIHDLRGSTRGFIRSDEPGLLSLFHQTAATAPFSVILVDEVEKAHPHLRQFFLPLMDRGRVTDNRGQALHFGGCLVVFTSNLGYEDMLSAAAPIGYSGEAARGRAGEVRAEQGLRKALSPEFMNRLKIVRFAHLDTAAIGRIFDLEFGRIAARFEAAHGLALSVDPAAREELIARGYSRTFGARHLAAVLHRVCNVAVARKIREDESARPKGSGALQAWLEEVRRGERAFDEAEVRARVFEEARARTPYHRLHIDWDGETFTYSGLQ